MEYRRFGKTEEKIPVFSCGGMRYQHSWQDVPPDEIPEESQKTVEACVLRALELGINHIETARGYGSSERQLGRILPQLPRKEMLIQTKVSPQKDPEAFLRTFDLCLERLGLDYVDFFSLHGINDAEVLHDSVRPGGCLDVARRLREQGRVRHIGFSTHAPTQIIVDAIESGGFDYVNLHWYYVNPFNWPAVQAAAARDMGVFIISPSDKGGLLYKAPEKLRRLCAPLTPMQFNDLFCLARPEVHTLSIGASRPTDFDEHVAALAHYGRIAETIAPIEQRLREEMERALGADWLDTWWHGIPEPAALPGEVHVHEIVRLWNLAKAFDLVEFGQMRYNLLGNGGHWFPGKRADGFDDAEMARALAASPHAAKIPPILREAHQLLAGEEKKRLSNA
jgi:predicted aldo/keto reductase-like oxidoreductase